MERADRPDAAAEQGLSSVAAATETNDWRSSFDDEDNEASSNGRSGSRNAPSQAFPTPQSGKRRRNLSPATTGADPVGEKILGVLERRSSPNSAIGKYRSHVTSVAQCVLRQRPSWFYSSNYTSLCCSRPRPERTGPIKTQRKQTGC